MVKIIGKRRIEAELRGLEELKEELNALNREKGRPERTLLEVAERMIELGNHNEVLDYILENNIIQNTYTKENY